MPHRTPCRSRLALVLAISLGLVACPSSDPAAIPGFVGDGEEAQTLDADQILRHCVDSDGRYGRVDVRLCTGGYASVVARVYDGAISLSGEEVEGRKLAEYVLEPLYAAEDDLWWRLAGDLTIPVPLHRAVHVAFVSIGGPTETLLGIVYAVTVGGSGSGCKVGCGSTAGRTYGVGETELLLLAERDRTCVWGGQ